MNISDNYWFGGLSDGGNSTYNGLPPQNIPMKKKDDEWKRACLTVFRNIGKRQCADNRSNYNDYYRMLAGNMAYSELKEALPNMSALTDIFDDNNIPVYIKHYDVIGVIIRQLIGMYASKSDKFYAYSQDTYAASEYIDKKQELFSEFFAKKLQKTIDMKLAAKGINPDPSANNIDVNDPEALQSFQASLQEEIGKMDLSKIEKYMSSEWKPSIVRWCGKEMETDTRRFRLESLDRENLKDFLCTGKWFRHYRMGYDSYEPEVWSPLNTFHSKDLNTKYPQFGSYVGRVHQFSRAQVISRYGHKMSKDVLDKLLSHYGHGSHSYGDDPNSFGEAFAHNFGKNVIAQRGYHAHSMSKGIQDATGIPMGEMTMFREDGERVSYPVKLPSWGSDASEKSPLGFDTGLIDVTEVYWISYKKVGKLAYIDMEGALQSVIVTEALLPEFLKRYGIKALTKETFKGTESVQEPNTVVWTYIPEVWVGELIGNGDDPIYFSAEPMEIQLKGESDLYDVRLPVVGEIGECLAKKLDPYQTGLNLAMNQLRAIVEKETGLFLLMDIEYLPSEIKGLESTEEMLVNLKGLAQDFGILPVNTSKDNMRTGSSFNQFGAHNLSEGDRIQSRMNLARYYETQALAQVGLNPTIMGSPNKYETASGIQVSQTAAYASVDYYFHAFGTAKSHAWETHLDVSRFYKMTGRDSTAHYNMGYDTEALFSAILSPQAPFLTYGIVPTNSSTEKAELERLREYVIQTNTLGGDIFDFAKIISSDTMSEVIDIARASRNEQERRASQEHSRNRELVERQSELRREEQQELWERQEASKQKDREVRIRVEEIEALGRAADKESDLFGINTIKTASESAVKMSQLEHKKEVDNAMLQDNRDKGARDYDLKMKELSLKTRELEEKVARRKADEHIARINKN